jgi:hypothetical protein
MYYLQCAAKMGQRGMKKMRLEKLESESWQPLLPQNGCVAIMKCRRDMISVFCKSYFHSPCGGPISGLSKGNCSLTLLAYFQQGQSGFSGFLQRDHAVFLGFPEVETADGPCGEDLHSRLGGWLYLMLKTGEATMFLRRYSSASPREASEDLGRDESADTREEKSESAFVVKAFVLAVKFAPRIPVCRLLSRQDRQAAAPVSAGCLPALAAARVCSNTICER